MRRAASRVPFMSLLTLQNLSFSFPKRVVFSELSLNAQNAALVVGRNGVGKTTLLRMTAHLLSPVSGSIWLDGREHYTASAFFTSSIVLEEKSVLDHIKWLARWTGSVNVDEALSLSGLGDLAESPARALSCGQKQLLSLAMACFMPSDLFIADEPFSHLDAVSRERACALLEKTSRERFVLLASTQKERLPFEAVLWELT